MRPPGVGPTHMHKTQHTHPSFSWVTYVAGVELKGGGTVAADLVVDASGRHSRLPRWLRAVGRAPARELEVDAGIAYSTRIYQLPKSVCARPGPAKAHPDLPYMSRECHELLEVDMCSLWKQRLGYSVVLCQAMLLATFVASVSMR